LILVVWLI